MEQKPHSVQDDFAVLRTHGFCENMADRENFGDRQCWERRWHRKNWCVACTERTDAIARIEEQLEAAEKERDRLFRENNRLGFALAHERSVRNPASERCPVCEGLDQPGMLHNERAPYCSQASTPAKRPE